MVSRDVVINAASYQSSSHGETGGSFAILAFLLQNALWVLVDFVTLHPTTTIQMDS